jgi:hypothetical protein
MPPLAAVGSGDFPSVELAGDCVETCVARRLDVPNDRQHDGSELRCLRLWAARICFTTTASRSRGRDNDARLKTTCRPDARSLQQTPCLAGTLACSAALKALLRLVPQREVVESVQA